MSIWLGLSLTVAALVLAVGWTFVPVTVSFAGTEKTCIAASVERSADKSELEGLDLTCRRIVDDRGTQSLIGLAASVCLIWGAYGIWASRRGAVSVIGMTPPSQVLASSSRLVMRVQLLRSPRQDPRRTTE